MATTKRQVNTRLDAATRAALKRLVLKYKTDQTAVITKLILDDAKEAG